MAPEPEIDQPKAGEAEESEVPESFDDAFEKGWSKHIEEEALTKAKETPPPKEGVDKKGSEKSDTRKPYKILKVQGKEIPVYSEEELIAKAQMGEDYTRKRQADSEDRKKWEEEYKKRADDLNQASSTFNKIWQKLESEGKVVRPGETKEAAVERAETKKSIYEEFDIDPEFAQPQEKKLVEGIVNVRSQMGQMAQSLDEASKAIRYFVIKETVGEMGRIINEERETHPFEDIVGEDGKSLTLQQFSSIITAKAKAAAEAGQKVDLQQITREAVRDVSIMQQKAKGEPEVSDDMSFEEFQKKFPKLASKYAKTAGQEAVDKHVEERSKVPPSLDRKSREVDLKKAPAKGESPKGMAESLEAAFQDPEILSALRGD